MATFQRIVVPTDLTGRADKALDTALTLGAPDTSRVILLHVIETIRGLDINEDVRRKIFGGNAAALLGLS